MVIIPIKKSKTPKCECGRLVAEGSVFCFSCQAEVKRRNAKMLSREKELSPIFYKKH